MAVKFEAITLETLCQFDPKIPKLFAKHIAHIAQDCANRPGDATPRTITLSFSVVPEMDDSGMCEQANLAVKMSSAVPNYKTKAQPVLVTDRGFKFNSEVPDELDQPALPGTV